MVWIFLICLVFLLSPQMAGAQDNIFPQYDKNNYVSPYEMPIIDTSKGDQCRTGWNCLDVANLTCDQIIDDNDGNFNKITNNQNSDDVFCLRPGNYKSFSGFTLTADGSAGNEKWITCLDSSDNIRVRFRPWENVSDSCIMKDTWYLNGADYWVFANGLMWDGDNDFGTREAVRLDGSDNNIFDHIYAKDRASNNNRDSYATFGNFNSSNGNLWQNSVSGPSRRVGNAESQGFRWSQSERNKFVNLYGFNNDANWKGFGNNSATCPGNGCGTIIDNCDFENTVAMRTDCNGNFTPTGSCTAAEPSWETKRAGVSTPGDWIYAFNNRIWGFWGPSDMDVCCATGSGGGLINNTDDDGGRTAYVLFQGNIIGPSEDVVAVGSPRVASERISYINNIFWSNKGGNKETLEMDDQSPDSEAYWNLFVDNDRTIDADSSADVRGNVFINNDEVAGGSSAGFNRNAYYDSGSGPDSTKIDLPNRSDANGTEFCFWRRLIWNEEQVCIPGVMISDTSPHRLWQPINPRSGKGVNNANPGTFPLNVDYWRSDRANEGTAGPWLQDQQPLPPSDGPVGFGENATGGEGGQSIVVTNLASSGSGTLREALLTAGPKIITFGVNGTIYPTSQLTTNANTTIDGRGADITLDGTFNSSNVLRIREDNIIVRNIKIENAGLDCIQITGSQTSNVWVDHVTMNGAGDELLSVVSQANNITLSWNKFTGPRFDIPAQDKGIMIGSSTTDTVDNVTLYNNWFDRMNQRIPRSRHAKMHWFNNLIASWNNYAASSSHFADMFLENNIYDAAGSPNPNNAYFASAFGNDTEPGEIRAEGNWMLNGATGTERNPQNVFDPNAFYTYSAVVADQQLRDAIENGAGWEGPSGPGPGGIDTSGLNRGIERGYNRGL